MCPIQVIPEIQFECSTSAGSRVMHGCCRLAQAEGMTNGFRACPSRRRELSWSSIFATLLGGGRRLRITESTNWPMSSVLVSEIDWRYGVLAGVLRSPDFVVHRSHFSACPLLIGLRFKGET